MAGPSHTSPSSSSPTTASPISSKLPKFLSRQQRDRSKSAAGVQGAPPSSSLNPPANTPQPSTSSSKHTVARKSSNLFSLKEKEDKTTPPTIIEPPVTAPPSSPRSRFASTSESRPMSTVSDSGSYNGGYSSSSSRFSDLPSRLSGWISHTFTGSSTDLSLPSLLSQTQMQSAAAAVSPKSKAVGLLTAARHGKDKAMRYLLDSDAQPDKCTDPIWLMGVLHPGYEPPPIAPSSPSTPPPTRRDSIDSKRSPASRRSSSSSSHSYSTLNTPPSTSSSKHPPPWPSAFYTDFTSRIWLTYRSSYAPIRDTALSSLDTDSEVSQLNSSQNRRWNWPGSGEKAWTSDTGWGCMLRTGQSMLANALIDLHLSRDWRRPPQPSYTEGYATYVKILTWFFDNPSPQCPFSIHRMALAGKELGKDVGQWFGPSTAAGAIKRLVSQFPDAQLAVSVAMDGVIFDSDVYAASHDDGTRKRATRSKWGNRAVLVLVGIRLGIDGVNPIYYEGVKSLFTFPQSVGIAGGRPSSSYYFVGTQADTLFYLDPHHTRPTIVFQDPPGNDDAHIPVKKSSRNSSELNQRQRQQRSSPIPSRTRSPTSPSHHTLSPSPLSHEYFSPPDEEPSVEDPVLGHYVNAYSLTELRTFHCDRVRKLPLSGLDPSMLLGFLCKDEADYQDFRNRVATLCKNYKPIFSIQAEPPSWGDGSDDVGLESFSEPDAERDQDDGDDDAFFSSSPSPIPPSTEESSIDPPDPAAARISDTHNPHEELDSDVIIEDDDDEWIAPTPLVETPQIVNIGPSKDNRSTSGHTKAGKGSTYRTIAPGQHFPFPSSDGDELNQVEITSRTRDRGESRPMPHLRSMRARDGGRTQSGGVKGVYRDSGDES
ncbi:hypothetical protein M422DRAFT_46858 [Sphaerobolus stellatus SS14]|uniref:Cysteine protease n=1 Tax=Sphaerobolus stellatus (strain SS14) TaxID=990650 RepID=A0A0C9W244_SPHS4|nr:hypothetical protein M422DRAFT_46858 [Sphaerobolus stellatus SS14]